MFHAVAQTQRKYGLRAAGRYIVSFTQSADDLAHLTLSLAPALEPAAAADHWRSLTLEALGSKRTVLNNVLHIALGPARSARSAHTLQAAMAALDDLTHSGPFSVLLHDSKDKAASICALLQHANRAARRRKVAVDTVELADVRNWSAECAHALYELMSLGLVKLALVRVPQVVRESLTRIFAAPPTTLLELDLDGSRIGDDALGALWHAVPRLVRLVLTDCKLTDAGVPLLCELLFGAATLKHLALADNRFSAPALGVVAAAVARLGTVRQLINGDQQHDTIVHARAEVAERNATRRSRSCSRRCVGRNSRTSPTRARCVRRHQAVTQAVTPDLEAWKRVDAISVVGVGLVTVAPFAPIATGLVVLSLRHNRLTEISRLVANALVDSCPLLAEFDLSFNRLRALRPALGRLAKLRWLTLTSRWRYARRLRVVGVRGGSPPAAGPRMTERRAFVFSFFGALSEVARTDDAGYGVTLSERSMNDALRGARFACMHSTGFTVGM